VTSRSPSPGTALERSGRAARVSEIEDSTGPLTGCSAAISSQRSARRSTVGDRDPRRSPDPEECGPYVTLEATHGHARGTPTTPLLRSTRAHAPGAALRTARVAPMEDPAGAQRADGALQRAAPRRGEVAAERAGHPAGSAGRPSHTARRHPEGRRVADLD